jgi:hypothetical protein
MEDGRKFEVFRALRVEIEDDDPEQAAIFKVRFRFRNLSPKVNPNVAGSGRQGCNPTGEASTELSRSQVPS